MSLAKSIKNFFHKPRLPVQPPAGPVIRSQRQANQRPHDPTPYQVKHVSNFGRAAGTLPAPVVGKMRPGKLASARVFNATNDNGTYLIPKNRPAANHVGAANGAQDAGRFLNGRKIKERLDISLAAAQVDFKINIAGNTVIYADSTNASDRVQLRFGTSDGDQSGPLIPFRPGQEIAGERYTVLYVTNAAIAGATATLLICEDSPSDPLVVR